MPIKNFASIHLTFLILFLFIVLSPAIVAQDTDGYDPETQVRWQKMLDHTKLIDNELEQSGLPDWAGFYHWGSLGFVGSTLKIAPKSGFVYRRYTDVPSKERPESFDFGKFEVVNGAIRFYSVLDNLKDKNFFPLKWGERNLLIPEDKMLTLATQYNTGCGEATDFRDVGHLYFPTKADEVRKRLFGKPSVPPEYERNLFSEPIQAKLVSIINIRLKKDDSLSDQDWYEQYTTITLNVGSKHGLLKGMTLYSPIASTDNLYYTAEITKLSENAAEAEIYRNIKGTKPVVLPFGLDFSTKLTKSILNDRTSSWSCR